MRENKRGTQRGFGGRGLPRALAWAAAGLLLALAGCGDLSLVEVLKGDSPGKLRLSPATALVPLNTAFTFSVLGGFQPYAIAVAGTLLPKAEQTWVFPGQVTITGESQDFTIQATDLLGNTATAVVTVFAVASALALNVQEVTLVAGGDSCTLTATGGASPYTWSVDDVPQLPIPDDDNAYIFVPDTVGSFVVSVTDRIGVSRAATIQVVPDPGTGSALAITPSAATVPLGGQLSFVALGGSGTYSFSASLGSFADANANPATYLALVGGTDTVSLSDGVTTVQATVTVTADAPLALSPLSPTLSAVGDTVQFKASGGKPPYTFSTGKPKEGTIDPLTGLYTQVGVKNVLVTVRDDAGATVNTLVKFK